MFVSCLQIALLWHWSLNVTDEVALELNHLNQGHLEDGAWNSYHLKLG
jgi:hypothetical protein